MVFINNHDNEGFLFYIAKEEMGVSLLYYLCTIYLQRRADANHGNCIIIDLFVK